MVPPIRPAEIAILGRTIAYASGGEGDRDVLFLHGYGSDRSTWIFTLPAMAEVASVYALDLPGHGWSSLDVGSGDLGFLADVVRGFMDTAGLEAPYVVGHSLGGAIALEVATTDATRLSGLSLIAPAGLSDTINREFTEGYAAISSAEEARKTLSMLVARPTMIGARMVRDVLANIGRPGVATALRTVAAANFPDGRQRHRYDDRLATLGIPVEIVWGEQDRILPPRWKGTTSIPVQLIGNAGHLAHMERPREVNAILAKAIIPA